MTDTTASGTLRRIEELERRADDLERKVSPRRTKQCFCGDWEMEIHLPTSSVSLRWQGQDVKTEDGFHLIIDNGNDLRALKSLIDRALMEPSR